MTAFKDLNVTVWHENLGLNNGQAMKLSELYDHFKFQLIDDGFIEANPKRFVKPKIEDVRKYFFEHEKLAHIGIDGTKEMAKRFYNHWDSLNWYSGKTRIKSWKGRAATWIGNNYGSQNSNSSRPSKLSVTEQVAEGIRARENEYPANTEESGQVVASYD